MTHPEHAQTDQDAFLRCARRLRRVRKVARGGVKWTEGLYDEVGDALLEALSLLARRHPDCEAVYAKVEQLVQDIQEIGE